MTLLHLLALWFLISIPVGILVGKMIHYGQRR